jgi:hypothetical protein
MSYYVSLSIEARQRLSSWGLTPSVIRDILDGLDALSDNPRDKLIRVGPPDDEMQYDLMVVDAANPGRDTLFVFSARYSMDEETLHLFDCRKLTSDQID